ncbi:MAG TPA: hypothetical protein VJZ71_12975 [Phycisphaerae bacterium]|nr:hypothetical protein [Phycisphaerae bacterium]
MKDDRISNWFTTGSAAAQPKEGTLFYEAVIEPRRNPVEAGNDIAPLEPRPSLTLVHEEDEDIEEAILRDHSEPLDTIVPTIAELAALPDEDEHDAWPWEDEVESSKDIAVQEEGTPESDTVAHRPAPLCREDDHSASEDVILCEPTAVLGDESTVELEESTDTAMIDDVAAAAPAYALKTVNTPKRIGSGQLVPARLTWRPGDPFGSDARGKSRFRWELMLTSACVTAACGLGCIWLLRTLLA